MTATCAATLAPKARATSGSAVSCSLRSAALIATAAGRRLRCRPDARSTASSCVTRNALPCSGVGAFASTASASREARSSKASSAAG